MARLFITIGFDSRKPDAQPVLVYLGRSGAEQSAAEATSSAPRFLRFNNAVGLPKNNPRASANAEAEQSGGSDADSVIEVTHAEMHAFQDEMKRLQQVAADRSVEIGKLTDELAKTRAELVLALNPPPAVPPATVSTSSEGAGSQTLESFAGAPAEPPATTSGNGSDNSEPPPAPAAGSGRRRR